VAEYIDRGDQGGIGGDRTAIGDMAGDRPITTVVQETAATYFTPFVAPTT
jgi:hypothetical protein